MQVQIETQSVTLPSNSRQQIAQRIERSLGRLAGRVSRLHVSLTQTGTTPGSATKLCRIHARLAHGKEIVVTDKSQSAARSIFRGVRRLKQVLARVKKSKRRMAPSLDKLAMQA